MNEYKKQVLYGKKSNKRLYDIKIDSDVNGIDLDKVQGVIIDNKTISEDKISNEMISIENYVNSSQSKISQDLVLSIVKPITDYRNNFNEFEGNILTELMKATKLFRENFPGQPKRVIKVNKICENYKLIKIALNYLNHNLQQIVKISQNLRSFHDICTEDRIALIKYGFIEVNNIFRIKYSELGTHKFTLWNVRSNYELLSI